MPGDISPEALLNMQTEVKSMFSYNPHKDVDEQINELIAMLDSMCVAFENRPVEALLKIGEVSINNEEEDISELIRADDLEALEKLFSEVDRDLCVKDFQKIQSQLRSLKKEKTKEKRIVAFQKTIEECNQLPTMVWFNTSFIQVMQRILMHFLEDTYLRNIGYDQYKDVFKDWGQRDKLPDVEKSEIRSLVSYPFGLSDLPFEYMKGLQMLSINPTKNETIVRMALPVSNMFQSVFIPENYAIIDDETGDRYIIRGRLPIKERIDLGAYVNNVILLELVFPPLGKEVKTISFKNLDNTPWSNYDLSLSNIKVQTYKNRPLPKVITATSAEIQARSLETQLGGFDKADVPPFEVSSLAVYSSSESFHILSIEKNKKYVKVNLGVSVNSDNQAHLFTKNLFFVDCSTGDIYRNYYVEKGYKFNTPYYIQGMKGKVVQLGIYFPAMKKFPKRFNLTGARNNPNLNTLRFENVDSNKIFFVKK